MQWGAYFYGKGREEEEAGLLIRRGREREGGILLRGTKGRKRRREGTEREAKGIPPKVNVSGINTGMTGWSDHWESLKKSCLVMYNIKRWSKKL